MTSEQHTELLRQQDRDRAGEDWQVSPEELEAMANDYYYEEEMMSENLFNEKTAAKMAELKGIYDGMEELRGRLVREPQFLEALSNEEYDALDTMMALALRALQQRGRECLPDRFACPHCHGARGTLFVVAGSHTQVCPVCGQGEDEIP